MRYLRQLYLNNAIESVEKLREQEKRLIHLSVAKQKNFSGSGVKIIVRSRYSLKMEFRSLQRKTGAFMGLA